MRQLADAVVAPEGGVTIEPTEHTHRHHFVRRAKRGDKHVIVTAEGIVEDEAGTAKKTCQKWCEKWNKPVGKKCVSKYCKGCSFCAGVAVKPKPTPSPATSKPVSTRKPSHAPKPSPRKKAGLASNDADANCKAWCEKWDKPKETKCGSNYCKACSFCHGVVVKPKPKPPPKPMPPPSPSKGDCKDWCEKDTREWIKKCHWGQCMGCAYCHSPAYKKDWDRKIKGPDDCRSACRMWTCSWSKKCKWKSCVNCKECGGTK